MEIDIVMRREKKGSIYFSVPCRGVLAFPCVSSSSESSSQITGGGGVEHFASIDILLAEKDMVTFRVNLPVQGRQNV